MADKFEFLDAVSRAYRSDLGFERKLIEYDIARILKYLKGRRVLEMGCANGVMTKVLSQLPVDLDVVEGSESYIEFVKGIVKGHVRFFHSMFNDFTPECEYDAIIMASVLEHVENPATLLRKTLSWLEPEGELHIIVPNARSLHRRIGVEMGIIKDVTELGPQDIKIGHLRVYVPESIDSLIQSCGLKIVRKEGIFLKPLSNAQMEDWPDEVLDQLAHVGESVPDMCAHIYRLCSPSKEIR